MPDSEETPVWSGCPSQWLNFGIFAFCFLVAGALVALSVFLHQPLIAIGVIVPAIVAFTKWLGVRSTRIDVSTERITTTTGVFSRRKSDMELYRVKDTALHEPFLLRLVRRANIEVSSSDRSSPSMMIPAIANGEELRQKIRANVERLRLKRGVRELDMDVERS